MSTSLLYHGFAVRGYRYKRTSYVGGKAIVVIERKEETYRGAACGSKRVWRHGMVVRWLRALPIGSRQVELQARILRLACQDCGAVRQTAVGFAEPRRSDSKRFARYVLELSQHMTIKDVACHLGVRWAVVKEIQKESVHRRLDKPRLKGVWLDEPQVQ